MRVAIPALLQDSDDLPITTLHDHVALDLRKDTEEAWALLVKHGRQPMEMIGAGSFGIVSRP